MMTEPKSLQRIVSFFFFIFVTVTSEQSDQPPRKAGAPTLIRELKPIRERELVRSYVLVAQPRSSGTFHTSALADVYGCHYTNELYHGSEEETKRNFRHAIRHEIRDLIELGFHVTAPGKKKPARGYVPCTVFKIKPYDPETEVSSLLYFDAIMAELGALEVSGNASLNDPMVEAHPVVLLRNDAVEQALSFAAMGVTAQSYKKRDPDVEIPGAGLRFAMEELCNGRQWMGRFRQHYAATLITEFIGTKNVVPLPNKRELDYSVLPFAPYSPQTFELDANGKEVLAEFQAKGCAMFEAFAHEEEKGTPAARFLFWGTSGSGGGEKNESSGSSPSAVDPAVSAAASPGSEGRAAAAADTHQRGADETRPVEPPAVDPHPREIHEGETEEEDSDSAADHQSELIDQLTSDEYIDSQAPAAPLALSAPEAPATSLPGEFGGETPLQAGPGLLRGVFGGFR
jgi:hypothetical protein